MSNPSLSGIDVVAICSSLRIAIDMHPPGSIEGDKCQLALRKLIDINTNNHGYELVPLRPGFPAQTEADRRPRFQCTGCKDWLPLTELVKGENESAHCKLCIATHG